MINVTEDIIINVLNIHAPIKAIRICSMLSKEYGKIDKREVNSILYRMEGKGLAHKNEKHEWSLGQIPKQQTKKTAIENHNDSSVILPEIEFSEEQEKTINIEMNGNLLVRGQAGSGKTTILAARAGKALSVISKGSILFLTYNSALCRYVDRTFKSAGAKKGISVTTFHDWAKTVAEYLGYGTVNWATQKERTEQIKKIISRTLQDGVTHRLYDPKDQDLISWWNDEIAWLFGQGIADFTVYNTIERIGRGTAIRLPAGDREYVWYVFDEYMKWLNANEKEDYDNVAGLVNKAVQQNGGIIPEEIRYDHVFLDEVQDFDKSWLSVLSKVPRISLSMAGDFAQKIYKRSFTWKSVGIMIQSHRSCSLKGSHRTTKQIMEVASKLVENSSISLEEDYIAPVLPIRNGTPIVKIVRNTTKTAYDDGYKYVAKQFKRIRTASVAIALPFQRQLYPAQKQLQSLGINADKAKGAALGRFSSGIVVTNYHQLKGLEFDHVVIFGLDDHTFPERYLDRVFVEDFQEEEQLLRKLLYVVMTRAKQSLTLIGGKPFCRFFDSIDEHYFQNI